MKRILILFFIISYSSLYAYELRLHFSRSYSDNNILYADAATSYDNNIYQNIKKYLDNGIIVFINFRIDLLKKNLFIDDNIREIYLYRKIYYDFFTKEYVVLSSETMRETRSTNLQSLINNFSKINRIEIINIEKLNSNNNSIFMFRTRLSMQFQNAYPYLSVFFNIITPIQYRIKWLKSKEFSIKDLY